MPALLELELQAEKGDWTDFKVFIVEENPKKYAGQLKKELNNPKDPDLIHEIDKNFNFEDLEIFKKDKIIFIISSFEEKWQEKTVKEIIKKAIKNQSKVLITALDKIPQDLENEVFLFLAEDKAQLLVLPKLIIGSVLIPGFICIDPADIYTHLLTAKYGKVYYLEFETYPGNIEQLKNLISKKLVRNPKILFIDIKISLENSFADLEDIASLVKDLINPEIHIISGCIDKNLKDKKMKIHIAIFT